jgi:hypothetical protein
VLFLRRTDKQASTPASKQGKQGKQGKHTGKHMSQLR